MPFIGRWTWSHRNARIYVHEAGAGEAFGTTPSGYPDTSAAAFHAINLFTHRFFHDTPADFLIAALYGDHGDKIAEVFGYSGTDPWPGNPDVYSWVFRNGIYRPSERQIACADTMLVLGREEEARRRTPDLRTYLANPPDLGDLLRD